MEKLNKLSFSAGFSAMQNGQKSSTVNAEPRLIAASTLGKFTITAPVSKMLNIAVGDNVLFLDNRSQIEEAIQQRLPEYVAYAEENNIDLDTPAGVDEMIRRLRTFAITKGVKMFDNKGNAVMASARLTKEDKEKYIVEHADEILEANRDALIKLVGDDNATDEELKAAISVDMIEGEKYHASNGSKTMTTGMATGVGCQLNFTDTAIWNLLKSDLGDDKDKKNRIFDVVFRDEEGKSTMINAQVSNGKEMVDVIAYPIVFKEDVDPIVRERKNEE